jgi:hypothetical protein
MQDIDVEKPEQEGLFPPSQFQSTARAELNLNALANIEYQLREARAYQSLDQLRNAIRVFNSNVAFKKTDIDGTGANTKAQNYLKTLANDIQIAGTAYRWDRECLLLLGLPEDNEALRPLLRHELRGKAGTELAAGQTKESDPWFWRVGRPSNLTEREEREWNVESELLSPLH